MSKRRLWPLAAIALVAALAAATTASARLDAKHASKVKVGGTLVFAAEQNPDCLNLQLNPCNAAWAQWMETPVIRAPFLVMPDFSYKPDLVSKVSLHLNPMRLTYYIKKNAMWSDGQPVTANDFIFTLKTILNPKLDQVTREGYNLITSYKVIGKKKKTIRFTFKKNFADWKDLFGPYVLPSHALAGADMSTAWNDGIVNPKTGKPIADGPFMLTNWQKNASLTLVRNPRWWGGHKAYLNSVQFRFLQDQNTEATAVRGGEVDAAYPQPNQALVPLRSAPGIVYKSNRGTSYELIELSQADNNDANPLMKNLWVRQAIAYATNRQALVNALFGQTAPGLPVLQSLVYVSNAKDYEPHFQTYGYNPTKAQQLLTSHGCKKGGDGIFTCNGTKLSLKFEWNTGNTRRATAFAAIQDMWKGAGIEAVANAKPFATSFGQDLPNGNFGVFLHAFVAPPDPAGNTPIWSCPNNGGTQNNAKYCNPKTTAALKQADNTVVPGPRAKFVNAADKQMAADVASLPMWQLPTVLVYHTYVKGMSDDPTNQGFSYNAENWWLDK